MKAWTEVLALGLIVSFSSFFVNALCVCDAFADGMGMTGGQGQIVDGPTSFSSMNADPKENLATSLRVASREGRVKEVQRLLDAGADPNGTGEFGETALMNAARYNQAQVAELLLAKGAEVNARDSQDNTALEKAAKNCSFRIGEKLLAHGADVNWINSEGRTALITAAQVGCRNLVHDLLQARGIRLNQQDNSGMTALDYALTEAQTEVGGPYSEIALLLRKAGAKTMGWQTPVNPAASATATATKKIP